MRRATVLDNETLAQLAARLGLPGCMIMRANRIYSTAWLLPGREIEVPDDTFCLTDDGICPVAAMMMPAGGDMGDCPLDAQSFDSEATRM